MKCDELKDYRISTRSDNVFHCYIKSEVDEAIAELKKKIEDAQATAYTESVDAGMRERRLKRALWMARAEMAKEMCRRLLIQ